MKNEDNNDIDNFLSRLKILSISHEEIRDNINIEGLTECLKDLNNLIELNNVKKVIIKQIQLLIVLIIKRKNGVQCDSNEMLHSVFYGTPGVGKSKTAKILANIWSCLNVIKSDFITDKESKDNYTDLLLKVNIIRKKYLELCETCKNNKHINKKLTDEIKDELTEVGNQLYDNIKVNTSFTLNKGIIIAGRENFVAEYTGQTAIKAYNFLTSCLGKCLIIEEAYLLYHGESDSYGMEALTIINRFMDEHASNIIIIFTGYEDKLKDTIFKVQPGLKRRCQWFFNLKGYSAEGLSMIFLKQLNQSGWKVDDSTYIVTFFKEYIDMFPNFGGDTEKLTFQCKLIYTDLSMNKISSENFTKIPSLNDYFDLCLTQEILILAYQEYLKNCIL